MMRIFLFLATNAAILVVVSVVFRVLGLDGVLAQNGVDLDLQALLITSAVIGFTGSFISLAMSKFLANFGSPFLLVKNGLLLTDGAHLLAACIGRHRTGGADLKWKS